MSMLSTYQDRLARCQKDISDLNKKIADEEKRICDKQKQINSVERSVTKYTSISSLQSKQNQVNGYNRDIANMRSKIADLQKKIAQKNSDIARISNDIRREEESERKKIQRQQEEFQRKMRLDVQATKSMFDNIMEIQKKDFHTNEVIKNSKEFDFFISHASEDKDGFVKELVNALKAENLEVWYDETELKIGDSLREKIDNGLLKSKYGIVVISPDFIQKKWTAYEFNGMISKEMAGGKMILPIWHNVTKDAVIAYSPTLADKVALNTSIQTVAEIATELKKLVSI